jgi:predicted dehydrogenase
VSKVFEKAQKDASEPKVFTDYQGVYDDPDVDVVYIGMSWQS